MEPLTGDLVLAGMSQAFSVDSCDVLSGAGSQAGSFITRRTVAWPLSALHSGGSVGVCGGNGGTSVRV